MLGALVLAPRPDDVLQRDLRCARFGRAIRGAQFGRNSGAIPAQLCAILRRRAASSAVAADVLALFGTLCWLFSPSVWVVPTHVSLGVGLLFDGTMRGTLLLLAALAVGLLVGAVGLLIVGEVFDKILCLRRKRIPEHDRVAAVFGFARRSPSRTSPPSSPPPSSTSH